MGGLATAQHQGFVTQPLADGSLNVVTASQGLGGGITDVGGVVVRQQVGQTISNTVYHAAAWSGVAYSDWHPAGFVGSTAQETDVSQTVGSGVAANGQRSALLWTIGAGSAVNLHPASFDWSTAWGVGGGSQVGYGKSTGGTIHALLWSGTAASVVDLHPAGFTRSFAYGCSATDQVGEAVGPRRPRPMRWTGSAASVVDMTPAGTLGGAIYTTTGAQQAGHVILDGPVRKAALWSGTPGSYVSMHPTGYVNSTIWDMSGEFQAGYARDASGKIHAILWRGTAASAVDLNNTLPAGYTGNAFAFGVDREGNVFGHAQDGAGKWNAVYWAGDRLLTGLLPVGLDTGTYLFIGQLAISFGLQALDQSVLLNEQVSVEIKTNPGGVVIDTSTYAATNLFTFDLLSGLYTYTVGTGLPSGSYTLTFTFANGWKKVCLINKLL